LNSDGTFNEAQPVAPGYYGGDEKSGWQEVGYNGEEGDGKDALGPPWDPNKNTAYIYPEDMEAIDLAFSYGEGFSERDEMTPWDLTKPLLDAKEMTGDNEARRRDQAPSQLHGPIYNHNPVKSRDASHCNGCTVEFDSLGHPIDTLYQNHVSDLGYDTVPAVLQH
jgi:hypothetical protein